jgi:hypothetical protein
MTCPCRELEELRAYKREAEKRIRGQEKDLIALSHRCAALAETLKHQVKEGKK